MSVLTEPYACEYGWSMRLLPNWRRLRGSGDDVLASTYPIVFAKSGEWETSLTWMVRGHPVNERTTNAFLEATSKEGPVDRKAIAPIVNAIFPLIGELDEATVVILSDGCRALETTESYFHEDLQRGYQLIMPPNVPAGEEAPFQRLCFYAPDARFKLYLEDIRTSARSFRYDRPYGYIQQAEIQESSSVPTDSGSTSGGRLAEPEGAMAVSGDRSQDAGLFRPEVKVDDQGRVTQYKLPDGTKYDVAYVPGATDLDSLMDKSVAQITISIQNGISLTFIRDASGRWEGLEKVSESGGRLSMVGAEYVITINTDGSFLKSRTSDSKPVEQIGKDGTVRRFDQSSGTVTILKPGSQIAEVIDTASGDVKRYEVSDDRGRVTTIEKTGESGTFVIRRGEQVEEYISAELDGKAVLKLLGRVGDVDAGSTLELNANGTEITRNEGGYITRTVDSDGEVTEFTRGANGEVTALIVKDQQGEVAVRRSKGIVVNDTDGSYTISLTKDSASTRHADQENRRADR